MLSASADGTVRRWDLDAPPPVRVVYVHDRRVDAVAFAPDGRTVYSTSPDGTTVRTPLDGGESEVVIERGAWRIDVDAQGRLATWTWDDAARVTTPDAPEGIVLRAAPREAGATGVVAFHPLRDEVAVASLRDPSVLLAPIDDPASGHHFDDLGTGGAIVDLAFDARGDRLAVALGREIRIFRAPSRTVQRVVSGPAVSTRFQCVAVRPDGRRLAAGDRNGSVWTWSVGLEHEASPMRLSGHADEVVYDVAYSPDGHRLISAGGGGRIVVWDAETGDRLTTLTAPPRRAGVTRVFAVDFDSTGEHLVSAHEDGTVRVWSASALPEAGED